MHLSSTSTTLTLLFFTIISLLISTLIKQNLHTPTPSLTHSNQLHPDLLKWENSGFYTHIHDYKIFAISLKAPKQSNVTVQNKTCVILHGFPSSSFEYSYGAAIGLQQLGYDVILHDHVGFGFSDKPINGFGYSIHDHADIALAFYKTLDHVNPVVFIGHDMGDSILTEILSRYQRDPSVFPSSLVIDKVIFTNGGMYMREASLRLSQRLLSSSIAEEFSNLASNIDPTGYIPKHQLNTVFSSRVRNEPADTELGQLKTHQIQLIQDMLNFKGGNVILWRLAKYLQDRYACEERWMAALNKLQRSISIHFIWGSDDSVAPLNIPKLFIEKADLDSSKLTVVEGKGHFWMLENGDGEFWAAMMHDVIANGK